MRIPPSTSQELQQAQQILKELQGEVAREEGTLAYGQKLGLGGEALAALRETNISFGNPYDNLVRLTPELFDAAGVSLNALQRRQMGESFDFYYMTLVASLRPRRGDPHVGSACVRGLRPRGPHARRERAAGARGQRRAGPD